MLISLLVGLLVSSPLQAAPNLENATAVREALDSRLTDYPSARFRRVKVSADGSVICGEINSRTVAGGYDGWKPMIVEDASSPAPDINVAQAAAVAREFLDRCAARTDWRPEDYSSALVFSR